MSILKDIASKDHRVKIIVNNRNFGVIRSGYYGFTQAHGDAVIALVADLKESDRVMNRTFWIGVYPGLSQEMLDYVIGFMQKAFL